MEWTVAVQLYSKVCVNHLRSGIILLSKYQTNNQNMWETIDLGVGKSMTKKGEPHLSLPLLSAVVTRRRSLGSSPCVHSSTAVMNHCHKGSGGVPQAWTDMRGIENTVSRDAIWQLIHILCVHVFLTYGPAHRHTSGCHYCSKSHEYIFWIDYKKTHM